MPQCSTVCVGSFSKLLSTAKTQYSPFGSKLLAAYLAVRHYHSFLEGHPFALCTDHKPLTFAIRLVNSNHSHRYTRHMLHIGVYDRRPPRCQRRQYHCRRFLMAGHQCTSFDAQRRFGHHHHSATRRPGARRPLLICYFHLSTKFHSPNQPRRFGVTPPPASPDCLFTLTFGD